ncbi:MAG: DUF5916 domain-containing protein [Planctomycetota bacterium]
MGRTRPSWLSTLLAGTGLAIGASAAMGQTSSAPTTQISSTGTMTLPTVRIVRTDTPPTIDGVIDEAVWADAGRFDQFTQVNPDEGAAPSERTEVRVLFDCQSIYFAVRCFDSVPDRIVSTQMRRDASIGSDDRIAIAIDPYNDQRNGFLFEMNPAGSRVDSLIINNDDLERDWDGIWYGRTSTDDGGWSAEIAIPFQTLSFNPNAEVWGLNVSRVIRRDDERVQWASPRRDIDVNNVGSAGTLEGIADIDRGLGLDIKPFAIGGYLQDHNKDRSQEEFDGGADVFYKFTASTTLALTFNTDFAETEVDERRINLTRFPLFFPEKRDFFLQDTGIFDFGGINRNPLPFQSRRIGLGPGGVERDILAGAKFTGRVGDLNFGFLDVQMKEDEELGRKNLFVGRMSYNVLDESQVGAIFTNGDPNDPGENRVGGIDFSFRNSNFNGNRVLDGSAFGLVSDTPGVQSGSLAYGFKIGYPNDRVRWQVGFSHIDDDYDAALGFVPRRGIREYFGNWRYRWRPNTWVRRIDTGVNGFLVTNLDNESESEDFSLNLLSIEFDSNDFLSFSYSFEREVLDEPFEISDGVVIPIGDFSWDRWSIDYRTSSARPVSIGLELSGGDFYTGDRFDTEFEIEWRASERLFIGFEFETNDVDLPQGDFITRLGRARVNIFFTPDLSWTTFAQYDNVSDTVGINSKVRWIIEPGNELFVVLNQGYDVIDDDLRSGFTELTSKVGWTFRF